MNQPPSLPHPPPGATQLRLRHPFKRQWAQGVWGDLFHALLNHTDPQAPPPWGALAQRLERHLRATPEAAARAAREVAEVAALLPSAGGRQ